MQSMEELEPEDEESRRANWEVRIVPQILDVFFSVFLFLVACVPTYGGREMPGAFPILAFCYYRFFCDGLGGRSLGKRLFRLQVLHESSGRPCGYWRSLFRNFLLYACLGFIDAVFIFGKERKRLGDYIAGTVVVKVPKGERPVEFAPGPGAKWGRRTFHAVLLAASGWLIANEQLSRTQSDVLLFNELPVEVEVAFGDKRVAVAAEGYVELPRVRAGTYEVTVTDGAGELVERRTMELPAGFDVAAYNILGASPLYFLREPYYLDEDAGNPAIPADRETGYAGEPFVMLREVDHVMEETPDEVYVPRHELFEMVTSFYRSDEGWFPALREHADEGDVEAFLELGLTLLRLARDDADARRIVRAARWFDDPTDFETVFHSLEAGRPQNLEMHLERQDHLLAWDALDLLHDLYADSAEAYPQSATYAYLNLRFAPPTQVLREGANLVSRFPQSAPLRARYATVLHLNGDHEQARAHFGQALESPEMWSIELVEQAAHNLAALGEFEEACGLVHELRERDGETTYRMVTLFARLQRAMDAEPMSPEMAEVVHESQGKIREAEVWVRLLDGSDLTGASREVYAAVPLAEALELGLEEAKRAFAELGRDAVGFLDHARRVAYAHVALSAGDRVAAEAILDGCRIADHVLADAGLLGPRGPFFAELPWEVRAVLELIEGTEHPAGSAERREHFERAREMDFLHGFTYRVSSKW